MSTESELQKVNDTLDSINTKLEQATTSGQLFFTDEQMERLGEIIAEAVRELGERD